MRQARIERTTKETSIKLYLDLDQRKPGKFKLGLPFLEHMLNAMSFHGGFYLEVEGTGDLDVDPHHLVEDLGLVFGQAFEQAVSKTPISRYGHSVIPMDDACSEAVVDLCKRPYLVYKADFPQDRSGSFDMWLFKEFFQAMASKMQANLHLTCRYGDNSHHMIEALFKALGRALFRASRTVPSAEVLSTKGAL